MTDSFCELARNPKIATSYDPATDIHTIKVTDTVPDSGSVANFTLTGTTTGTGPLDWDSTASFEGVVTFEAGAVFSTAVTGFKQQLSTTLAANGTVVVPAGYAIGGAFFEETANHAVTGGIRIGTTDGGAQVVAAQAVGALSLSHTFDAALLLRLFSMTVDTTLFIQAVTNWNGASVNIQIPLYKLS